MTVRLCPISQKVTLAHITRTYMADGGGKKKGKKGKKAVSTERNADVWAGLAQSEQHASAEEPVKAPPSGGAVNPTSGAPSTNAAAAVVEYPTFMAADHEKIREVMGPKVDSQKVIERCREGAARWAEMLNVRKAQT
jgi:hypothetical protein